MKRSFAVLMITAVLALALGACAPLASVAAPAANAPVRQMTANGVGEVYLTPDLAYVSIGVQNQSPNVATALRENNQQAQAVADALKELGVDGKDIQTSSFNIFPMQQYSPTGEMTGVVYQVNNTVYVTVRSLQVLPELLDKVVSVGANTINGISFDVADKSAAVSEARKLAIANAKANAVELAGAAGVELGDLMSLNSYTSGAPIPVFEGKGGMAMDAAAPPVSAGQLMITVNADLTYTIR